MELLVIDIFVIIFFSVAAGLELKILWTLRRQYIHMKKGTVISYDDESVHASIRYKSTFEIDGKIYKEDIPSRINKPKIGSVRKIMMSDDEKVIDYAYYI